MVDVSGVYTHYVWTFADSSCSREHGKTQKASKALYWLRPNENTVESELHLIQAAIDEDKQHQGKALWLEMWRNPVDRRRTILAIAAVNTQVASGAMYMIAYGT